MDIVPYSPCYHNSFSNFKFFQSNSLADCSQIMASLHFRAPFDAFDSKKVCFQLNHVDRNSMLPHRSCIRVYILNSLIRVNHCKVSRDESEFVPDVGLVEREARVLTSEAIGRVQVINKVRDRELEVNSKFRYTRRGVELDLEKYFVHDDDFDVNYSAIGTLSLECCNSILKRLEKSSESKMLLFFEWMRSHGRSENNMDAYTRIIRVLSRREDWKTAEILIQEMSAMFGSKLNYQVFNSLIYACCKRGLVHWSTKWFHMMLDCGVRPNVATIGMMMGLYRKGWNVEEAEFTFHQMRHSGIVCQLAYSAMITIYTRVRLYDKAEEIICFMEEDKVIPTLEIWLVVLNTYCQQGKLDKAEKIEVLMQRAGFPPNIIAYNTLITGYGKASNMVAAKRIFLNLRNLGLEPDETTYRSMIEGWGRSDNYEQALWCYNELKQSGYRPNSANLYTLLNLQAKHGDDEGAIRTLNSMLEIGCQYSSMLGIVLQTYESVGRIDKVPLLLTGSFYQQILTNQNSCSTLVMAYGKHSLVDETLKVLKDKRWTDPHFEDNLYHLLICLCKEMGSFDDAIKIFTEMPKEVGKPNLHIMCTMIDIYTIMGLFKEAEGFYLQLKSSRVCLDVIAYNIVIRMYVKAGSLKEACSVIDAMEKKKKNIIPDIFLLRDMLRIYQKCGMLDKLSDLYYRISKDRITWDSEMYNCVINCCSRAIAVDELSRVFDEMLQRVLAPNTITFNVMLDIYGKAKLFKKAKKLFSMAQKMGLVDVVSYNTLIAAYGKNKDYTNMSSTVQKMQVNGFSVSLKAYNSMLDAYGKDGQMEAFRKLLVKIKESSCVSDNYTYNIMINIYGEKGWIDEVAEVLSELKQCGPGPDICSYNTLIKAYGIAGMVEDAVALIKEMRQKGIEADKITYTNLIKALKRNDDFLEAVKWSLWMKQLKL